MARGEGSTYILSEKWEFYYCYYRDIREGFQLHSRSLPGKADFAQAEKKDWIGFSEVDRLMLMTCVLLLFCSYI